MKAVSTQPAGIERRARLLLGSLLGLATAAAMIQPVRSYDLWWHLATGRLMARTGSIPTSDPFSFTRAGTPWLDHEWLFQIFAYQGYNIAQWRMPILGTVVIGLVTYGILAACLAGRAARAGAGGLLLALSLAGARFRFDFRPEMLSYLFLAALCAILQASRREGRTRPAWLLFPLFALWANIHPAALLGAATVLAWLAGEWVQQRLEDAGARPPSSRIWIALASPAALLLNPGGWHLIAVPLEIRKIVASGHAPNREWLAPQPQDFPLFFASAAFALLVVLSPVGLSLLVSLFPADRRREFSSPSGGPAGVPATVGALRSGIGRVDWAPALVLGLMTYLAFQQLRNIGFFFLIIPLALVRPLSLLLERGRIPTWALRLLSGVVLALLIPIFLRGTPAWDEPSLLAQVAPEKAVRYLQANRVGERLFNDVKFGGYLIWKRYPEHRVFIDGRNEVYDPLLARIFRALSDWKGWQGMLDDLKIDAAMLRRGQTQVVQYPPAAEGEMPRTETRAFSAAYFQQSLWALVYWDDLTLIYVRRADPAYANLLQAEYRVVNPDDAPHLMQEIRGGRVEVAAALRDIDRKITEDPHCETALALRRQLLSLQSNPAN